MSNTQHPILTPAVCLVILDGWGIAPAGPGNAVSLANTPVFDHLWATYPHTELVTWGPAVGLPEGQMGNSEVGHLNLGAGAIVKQDLARIDAAIEDNSIATNAVLQAAFNAAERVHLIGLASTGGVHSGSRHLKALIGQAAANQVKDLIIHCFTDGRDTLPHSGGEFLEQVEGWCAAAGVGRIATVIGRYYGMDRDQRWDRTQKAYELLVHGRAQYTAPTGSAAVEMAYDRGETDEFIAATSVGAEGVIRPEDSVICFNFRPDRMRQIVGALADPECTQIERSGFTPNQRVTTFTEYEGGWPYQLVFPPERPQVTLGGVIAEHGLKQLHAAETEKYAHVTYFFNGGREVPYPNEERKLIPSPRDVPTYDYKPEMSAPQLAQTFAEVWQDTHPQFGVINFANPDMVGHTGVISAAVKAVETTDTALGQVVEAVQRTGGICVVTADHGNADHMLEVDGSPNTAHSMNPVPLIVTSDAVTIPNSGILADVAPTVLMLLGLEQPRAMTGKSLLSDRCSK